VKSTNYEVLTMMFSQASCCLLSKFLTFRILVFSKRGYVVLGRSVTSSFRW